MVWGFVFPAVNGWASEKERNRRVLASEYDLPLIFHPSSLILYPLSFISRLFPGVAAGAKHPSSLILATGRGFAGRYIFLTASNRQTSKHRPHLMQRNWSIKCASLRTPEIHVTGQFRAHTVQPTHLSGLIS